MSTQPQQMSAMRLLGLDRNPLRRFSDRIQSALLMLILVGCIAGLPIAVQAARTFQLGATHEARVQQSQLHRVAAIALEPGQTLGPGQSNTVRVKGTWQAPDGTRRHGDIDVSKGTRAGATVTIWTDSAGIKHKTPMSAPDIQAMAVLVGIGSYLGFVLSLYLAYRAAAWALNRARVARWAAEWEKLSPQWHY